MAALAESLLHDVVDLSSAGQLARDLGAFRVRVRAAALALHGGARSEASGRVAIVRGMRLISLAFTVHIKIAVAHASQINGVFYYCSSRLSSNWFYAY